MRGIGAGLVCFCYLSLVLCSASASAQDGANDPSMPGPGLLPTRTVLSSYEPPENSSPFMGEVGLGFGLPYGLLGPRIGIGLEYLSVHGGAGIVPLAWEPSMSIGASLHFLDRYKTIRPKLTGIYSTTTAYILFTEEGTLDARYSEAFDGFVAYAGFDWRISKTQPFLLDFAIGWTFPFTDKSEIEDRYDEVADSLRSEGWSVGDKTVSLDRPVISIGLSYSPGRALKPKYVPVPADAAPNSNRGGPFGR